MDAEIRERVLDLNPWLVRPSSFSTETDRQMPKDFVPRHLGLEGFEATDRAKLIVGPRQAGKSTFVWSLLRECKPHEVMFLSGEEPLIQRWTQSAAGVVRDLEQEFPKTRKVFLDEAQHLENAGLFIKGFIDRRTDRNIFVTGSSAFHLMDRTRESLAGRAERRLMLPLSVDELLAFTKPENPAAEKRMAKEIAHRQCLIGGYPGVWFHEEPQRELRNLVEAFVVRDVSDAHRIRRLEAFRQLLQLAAGQIGQLVNHAEWASRLGISTSTVREYLNILEESWIIHQLPAFSGGRRREITATPRVQFFDTGIRNALLSAFDPKLNLRPDRGAITEGIAFSELYKTKPRDWTLHFWRAKGGAEVDFVLALADRCIAIEIKAGRRYNLSRSARSFIDAYSPEAFIMVVNLDDDPETESQKCVDRTRIYWTNLQSLAGLVRRLAK